MSAQHEAQATEFVAEFQSAVDLNDRQRASKICAQLVAWIRRSDEPLPLPAAKKILLLLRRERYFDLVQQVADALIQSGLSEPQIRRQYAQALLDQGSLTAGILVIRQLVDATAALTPPENKEARGLLGRAYKQVYVQNTGAISERDCACLETGLRAYYGVYQEDPQQLWHGINSVALLSRAERDRVKLSGTYPDPRVIARQVLGLIETKQLLGHCEMWDEATAVEACVALNRPALAMQWLARYLNRSEADAFEFASTYRQLTEVWQLDSAAGLGKKILPPLMAQLLQRQGGRLDMFPESMDLRPMVAMAENKELEKVLGNDSFVKLGWLTTALRRAQAVALVENRDTGEGVGTGFLIRGSDLAAKFDGELLLLTNAHVLTTDPQIRGALLPEKAAVKFEAPKPALPERSIAAVLATSPPHALDFTLARLTPTVTELDPCPLTPYLPLNDQQQRVYIIGHPAGGKLSFSLHDSLLLDYDDRLLHYRTPTEGGSSGSPVFNDEWDLVGLHHAGGLKIAKLQGKPGFYAANEGIWIEAIRKAV